MKRAFDTEILCVGTEILLGHITNTDARDISELLAKIGINVKYHTVVGDNPERLRQCVEIAKSRADILITTGGLGPTCDDLTKQVLADCFGLQLERNAEAEKGLYEYINTGRGLTENTFQQALLPEGSTIFPNSCGTAPGCAFQKDGKVVLMLPGPPKECRAMFERSALPYLRSLSDETIVSHCLNIFGIGESGVDDIFADEMNRMVNPTMAPYAKECDCLLQITAKAETEAEAEAMIAPVEAHVREVLGDRVYGKDLECLEQAAMEALKASGRTFAACESCTGGDIARRFTELPGASAFFLGGAVTYVNAVKTELAGVPETLLEEKTAVSREVAAAMAEGIRTRLGADLAVSVTGLAGPDGDGVHEVGTVFIALAAEGQTFVRETRMGAFRTRSFIRRMAGNHAFDMIRRYLGGLQVE